MRMVCQVLAPGVQHGEEADLGAEVVRIGGDPSQRLRRRAEQYVVDDGLVLERDGRDLVRNGEHDVEVRHVEQLGLAIRHPLRPREPLALRAVPVAARIPGDPAMAAVIALLDMTAERGCAAAFDRVHRAPPRSGQRSAGAITESRAELAEYVRQFRSLAGHRTRRVRQAASSGVSRCNDSSGLTVARIRSSAIIRYRAVVLRLRCPSSNWMVRISVPASSRWTANAWRSACGATGLPMPLRSLAARQARFTVSGWTGWLVVAPGKQPFAWTIAAPVVAQHRQQRGRQHDVAILAALALHRPGSSCAGCRSPRAADEWPRRCAGPSHSKRSGSAGARGVRRRPGSAPPRPCSTRRAASSA